MKAIVVNELGDASVMKYADAPEPNIGSNEVLVNNKSIGVNFIDIYHRTGVYKKELPFTLGVEGAGVVSKVGSDVTNFKVGDRVAYSMIPNSYAEFTAVPQQKLVKVPKEIPFTDAAAVMLQGMTAHYLLKSTYPVTKNSKILIHAAAGGVGTLVVQIAKAIGAFVIATTSTEEKVKLVKELGADVVINYTTTDFVAEVKKVTNNKGVDVVYDSVAKETYMGSLDCLRPRGYFVLFGQSSGVIENFNPAILNNKGSLFMTRPSLGHYIATPEELKERSSELFKWMKDGKLKIIIDSEIPLSEASTSHGRLENRLNKGKVLLKP